MRTTSQQAGDGVERLVAERLAAEGWRVLARNVHIGRGEIDIVAVDLGPPARLVFVEVRWRRSRDFGLPEDTFDRRKRGRLWSAVSRLLEAGRLPDGSPLPRLPIGIDLIVVEPPTHGGDGTPRVRHHRDVLTG